MFVLLDSLRTDEFIKNHEMKLKLPNSKYWFVVVILLVSFVGIFDHDLWTYDEPRVAEIGREFLDGNASLAVPQLNGQPFLEKPPFYFWCVTLSYKIFGGHLASAARKRNIKVQQSATMCNILLF